MNSENYKMDFDERKQYVYDGVNPLFFFYV